MTGAQITIVGLVQGVGFRWFCQRQAASLGLVGWVRNQTDGTVQVCVEGERKLIDSLITLLQTGPSHAHVERIDTHWLPYTGTFTSFEIAR